MTIIKWKDFEVYHLLAICGEMDEEFTKTTITQGNLFLDFFSIFHNLFLVFLKKNW